MSVQLLRRQDVQKKLRIAKSTYFQWKREGKLPPAKSLNGLDVWIEADVDAWLTATLKPTGDQPK